MTVYRDEELEHWGEVFVRRDLLHGFGVRFDTFIARPRQILAALESREFRPLLRAQRAVRDRIDAELAALEPVGACLRGTQLVQPMHRPVFPKKWKTHTRH